MANTPTPDQRTVTIEAGSVEEALDRIDRELGEGASVVRAEKVRRGGVGGFFAREMVEITAALPGGGVEDTFARMLQQAEEQTVAPQTATPPVTPHQPATAHPAVDEVVAIAPPAVPTTGPFDPSGFLARTTGSVASGPVVRWDAERMLSVGLPEPLVGLLAGLEPTDDLGHLSALSSRLERVCGPVPHGPHRFAGAAATRLAEAIGVGSAPELSAAPIHLVLSSDPLPASLPAAPTVVSWTDAPQAPAALALAMGTGATLGWSMPTSFGAAPRRLTALDAAWAIRDLMERR